MPQVYRAIRPMFKNGQWRIFPDDLVQVVTGVEKGATGKVLAVIRDKKQPEVIVEGINMRKKKVYTGLKEDEFFVVSMEAPLHCSNVMLWDPASKKPVSTVFRFLPDGTRVRVFFTGTGREATSHIIPVPASKQDTSKIGLVGVKDTVESEVRRVTYDPSAPFPFQAPRRPSGLPLPAEPEASSSDSSSSSSRGGGSGRPLRVPTKQGPWEAPAWIPTPTSPRKLVRMGLHGTRPFSTALWGLQLSGGCGDCGGGQCACRQAPREPVLGALWGL